MRARDRDVIAGVIVAIALILGAAAWVDGRIDHGLQLTIQSSPDKTQTQDRIVILDVDPTGAAAASGLQPGMVVTTLNGRDVTRLPGWDPTRLYTQNVDGNGLETVVPYVPDPTPVVTPPDPAELDSLINQPIYSLAAVRPETLGQLLDPQQFGVYGFDVVGWSWPVEQGVLAWTLGLAILLLGGWWLGTGRAGESIRTLAIPAVVATATPLFLFPFRAVGGPVTLAASSVIASLALLPLADGLIARSPVRRDRIALGGAAIALAGLAALLGGGVAELLTEYPERVVVLWWFAAAAVTVIPGVLAARPMVPVPDGAASTPSRRLLESTEFAVLGLTPAISFLTLVQTQGAPFVLPILLWMLAILIAGRFTIRPLVRLATRAQLHRDLVVATMEAERSRIATNIHDDALQDVTLLVRRLDDAGDAQGAELARGVADRLRTISGDLRLPILDDLGVGPALDWLVSRTERIAGGEVRLELADGARPPASVELAVFRIAQEALTNAVKHGRPPIVVRYRAVESGVSLSVDDAGPGIEPGAADEAPAAGHFGILGMSQRAEQIGAILDVRRWPAGGTHVALEWRPR